MIETLMTIVILLTITFLVAFLRLAWKHPWMTLAVLLGVGFFIGGDDEC